MFKFAHTERGDLREQLKALILRASPRLGGVLATRCAFRVSPLLPTLSTFHTLATLNFTTENRLSFYLREIVAKIEEFFESDDQSVAATAECLLAALNAAAAAFDYTSIATQIPPPENRSEELSRYASLTALHATDVILIAINLAPVCVSAIEADVQAIASGEPFGDLWPDGEPEWYTEAVAKFKEEEKRGEAQTVEADTLDLKVSIPDAAVDVEPLDPADSFDLYIDPGNASVEQVQELLQAISDLDRAFGGKGIRFDGKEVRTHSIEVANE